MFQIEHDVRLIQSSGWELFLSSKYYNCVHEHVRSCGSVGGRERTNRRLSILDKTLILEVYFSRT